MDVEPRAWRLDSPHLPVDHAKVERVPPADAAMLRPLVPQCAKGQRWRRQVIVAVRHGASA